LGNGACGLGRSKSDQRRSIPLEIFIGLRLKFLRASSATKKIRFVAMLEAGFGIAGINGHATDGILFQYGLTRCSHFLELEITTQAVGTF
jgi:hypothetical protein